MTTRNQIRTVLSIAAVALVSVSLMTTSANAELVIEEHFDYEVGLVDTQNGGTGFDGAWIASKSHGRDYETGLTTFFNGPATTTDAAGGLFLGQLQVSGSALSRFGNAGRAEAHRPISAASQAALLGDGTTMWFSALFGGGGDDNLPNYAFGLTTGEFTTDTGAEGSLFGVLLNPGVGFGFTTADGGRNMGGADFSINAVGWDGTAAADGLGDPIIVQGTYEPTRQDPATHRDTSLIVGKVNWNANGTPDELYLFNVTDQKTEPSEGSAFASINIDMDQSTLNTVAMFDGLTSMIDEIRFGNTFADVTPQQVVLGLEVSTISGEISIQGFPTEAIAIDAYQILSPGSSLDAVNWNSLADQDIEGSGPPDGSGNGWEEGGGVGPGGLLESFLLGTTEVAAGASISLGNAYDTSVDAQDLAFTYRDDSGKVFEGLVEYVTIGFQADFDMDGDVDGDDFLAWQGGFGTPSGAEKSDGDYDNDGDVDGDDFLGWQDEFGSPGAGGAGGAVPEPSSIMLLAAGAAGWGMWRRRRKSA